MIRYGKLVRDRLPEIIAADGQHCVVRVLDEDEFDDHLVQKLEEELAEFRTTGDLAELADLVEVVRALAEDRGMIWPEFEAMRAKKRVDRGGFTKRLYLNEVFSKH